MSLEEYKRKRNFKETPEPPPKKAASHAGLPRFYIQRHHASHLHYDFRMEADGTLKSWAVPKGPTLDPGVKHFAAMVEDHPLEYGNFEGNIPKGQYGGGSVMLWDRGTYELLGDADATAQIDRGDFKFCLHGEKLNGDFALVKMKGRGKGNEWLLLKKRDDAAVPGWDTEAHATSILTGRTQEEIAHDLPGKEQAAENKKPPAKSPKKKALALSKPPAPGAIKAEMPGFFPPMAATLVKELPQSEDWIAELKWDGVRALSFLKESGLEMYTRSGLRCERQYPELSVLPHQVDATTAILDGEVAVLNAKGIPEFALIQPRIMNTDAAAIAHMTRTRPVVLFLFDLLYLDGWDLRPCALSERRKLLEKLVAPQDPIRVSDVFPPSPELLEAARQNGLEGLMGKCLTAPYETRRSRNWVKVKLVDQQEFVICGFTEGEREHFSSLVLGVNENGKLRYAGNVGTGFDNKLLASLRAKLDEIVTEKRSLPADPKLPKDVIWVKPQLVCEVKFSNWTNDGRLRAPVFLGLREDVSPKEVVVEKPQEENGANSSKAKAPQSKARGRVSKGRLELPEGADEATCVINGHTLKFGNLKKVFYPKDGYTKRDLLIYYDEVADFLLPHLKDRPLSLKRYPNGIHSDFFFQKNTPESFPDWLRFETIDGVRYVLADDEAALLYLTNLGCVDQNPWMSRVGTLHNPDWILIDLDPQECPFEMIIESAQLVKDILDEIGLKGYPKTTGGDGMHIYIPVPPIYTYEITKQFAEVMASVAVRRKPDLFTTPRSVSKRQKGRVYFDYLQNGEGKTVAAPYVTRAYDGAPVATPLDWDEVAQGLNPKQFNIKNAPDRFRELGDLFAGVLNKPQKLDKAFEKLEKLVRQAN
jgi:bifunctional non-homologous end joining protein LigD